MKTVAEFTEKVPTWALCYFVNSDDSGLTEEDKQQADKFWNKYQKRADLYECNIIFDVPDNIDSEKYFSYSPAFGGGCDVIDCTFIFVQ